MKIAVSSQGKTSDSQIDTRFGRALYFMITEDDGKSWRCLDHSGIANAPQGAGVQTGQKMMDEKVSIVLTGHVGPKAFKALSAGGIKVFTGVSGTIEQAFQQYKDGKLAVQAAPDVSGHWGQR